MNNEFVLNPAFCCPGFQNSIEAAGQRGMAILLRKTSEGFIFLLQSRGIAFEDVSKIKPTPTAPDIITNVSCDTGLLYCPWCGKRLQDLAKTNPQEFELLVKNHEIFF